MITEAELMALALKLREMGMGVEVNPEELEAYFPQVEDSFYVPKVSKNFYLGDTKMLRKLNTPNTSVFRRLVGAE